MNRRTFIRDTDGLYVEKKSSLENLIDLAGFLLCWCVGVPFIAFLIFTVLAT